MIERFPLTWPVGWPRTSRRIEGTFRVDFRRARDEALRALELLGARRVVLSSNVPIGQGGLPLVGMAEPSDPGIAVYFDRHVEGEDRPFVIACDTYARVRWNLRAIGATVNALRSIDRHGTGAMLEQAFTGFAALPASGEKAWWEVLGVRKNASPEEIRNAYRTLAMIHHPDRGGSVERMAEVNRARDVAFARGTA